MKTYSLSFVCWCKKSILQGWSGMWGEVFGHLPEKIGIIYKSLITSKRWEVELTVMSPLGYFRETLYFQRHQQNCNIKS